MTKVRGIYPSYIRIASIVVLLPVFYSICDWVLESSVISYTITVLLGLVLSVYLISGMFSTRFEKNIGERRGIIYDARDVQTIKAKTISNRWLWGVTITTLEFIFKSPEHNRSIRLTDTRSPFFPTRTGYSDDEVRAITLWLSYIPEEVEGYPHVQHLREMLLTKNLIKQED